MYLITSLSILPISRANGIEFGLSLPPSPNPQSSLQPKQGSIIEFSYPSINQEGIPSNPQYLQTRNDLNWAAIIQQKQQPNLSSPPPFNLSLGKSTGFPQCRICSHKMIDKNEGRISIDVMYHPPNSGPYPGRAYLCLKESCIEQLGSLTGIETEGGYPDEKANQSNSNHPNTESNSNSRRKRMRSSGSSSSSLCDYPVFQGKIGVPSSLKHLLSGSSGLSRMDSVQWIPLE